jgi:hypothetical protein
MGNCRYCGKPVGLFAKEHRECAAKHEEAPRRMQELAKSAFAQNDPPADLVTQLEEIAGEGYIAPETVRQTLAHAWCQEVSRVLSDGSLTVEEQLHLLLVRTRYGLTTRELQSDGAYQRAGKAAILSDILTSNLDRLDKDLATLTEEGLVRPEEGRAMLADAWGVAVGKFLEDDCLAPHEEQLLDRIRERYSLTHDELDRAGADTRFFKALTIRDALEGKLPQRVAFAGMIPFNLQKSESLVWVFQDVKYYEYRSSTHYEATSRGVSIRIARGVYYRVGAFKGHPVHEQHQVLADAGILGLTNKHLYFSGATEHFRVPYDKVVEFQPFSDGLGIQRDAATAKPQLFETGDGWFAYNLVINLARR